MKINYCPNCGKKISKKDSTQMPYGDADIKVGGKWRVGKTVGYDVYCTECDWSGNIEPDIMEAKNEKN